MEVGHRFFVRYGPLRATSVASLLKQLRLEIREIKVLSV